MPRAFASRHLAGVAAIVAACSAPVQAQTLPEAVGRAIATYPEIQAAIANRHASMETISQARAGFFPSVDASLGYGRERSDNPATRPGGDVTLNRSEADVTLSQMVYDGSGVRSQVRIQESRSDSAAHDLANTAQTIGLRAAQAYLDVLRLRAGIEIARSNVEAHQRTLEQVSLLAEKGAGRRSDVQQAEARLALAYSTLTGLRRQREQAEAAYRHLVGMAPQQLQKPGAPFEQLPPQEQGALEAAFTGNPLIRAAQAELEAAHSERESSRARLAPRVTIDLGASQNHDIDGVRGTDADRTAMLRVRYNLFRGGADSARIRESVARIDRAHATLDRVRNDVAREARTAWETFQADREQLQYLKAHADASAGVVEAYRIQFRLGQRTLLDVLNADNEHSNARRAFVDGDYSVIGGSYRILTVMGRLLEALGVALPLEARVTDK
jgi:adhesin transport system outer membrane protein